MDASNNLKTVAKISFLIKDDEVWEKYGKIWDVIKNKLSIKFHRQTYLQSKTLES